MVNSNFVLIGVGDIEFAFYKKLRKSLVNKTRPVPFIGNFCRLMDFEYNTEDTLVMIYQKGCAAGGSGDSGSPLWTLDKNKKPVVA